MTNNKGSLMELWAKDDKNLVETIHEAIDTPTKYIEFKNKYTEGDIRKAIVEICNKLGKDKRPEDWSQQTINQACQITRYYADIIKKQKENSLLNKKKAAESNNTQETNKDKEKEHNKADKDNNDNQKENKRKAADIDDDDIIINENELALIKDQDNINPTKRQRIISKTYLQDDDKLPAGWHNVQHLESKPVAIIKPNENNDVNTTKQLITDILEVEDREYGEIEQVTKTQKVVVVHFDDIANRDKFMKYVKTYQKTWQCEIPKLKNPCMRINGVFIRKNEKNEIDWNSWLEKLINKNKWLPKTKDSVFKINFKVEKNNKWNIVFEVSPNIRQAIIQKRGKIFLGLQKHEVYDTFNIYTCYNCSSYGHTTNQCGQQPVCRYCAKQHFTKCPIKEQPQKYKCHACKSVGHAFNDPTCEQFLWRLKHELQFINMNYEIIMTPTNQQ